MLVQGTNFPNISLERWRCLFGDTAPSKALSISSVKKFFKKKFSLFLKEYSLDRMELLV